MRKPESDLTRIAARLAGIIGPEHCVLVGALAVAVHGYPRATDDVDLLTRLDLKEAQKLLAAHGIHTAMKRGDILEGDFPCLQGVLDGVRFGVLPQLVAVQWNDLVSVPMAGTVLKVVDLDALIRLKLRAGGPQDLMDAAHLLLQHPERIGRARDIARTYQLQEKLDIWLADPRTRSQVEEELRSQGEAGQKILKQLSATLPSKAPRRS